MYINLPPISTPGASAPAGSEISADLSLPELSPGDEFSARVIFSGGGTVHLKTAEGVLLRARLEGGVTLAEGSEVTLTVVEKDGNQLRLSIAEALPAGAAGPGSTSLAGRSPDLPPGLAAVFEQLQTSSLPASQKLELFLRAVADFPALSAQDSAVQQATATLVAESSAAPLPAPATAGNAAPQPTGLNQLLQQLTELLNQPPSTAPASALAATEQAAPPATAPIQGQPGPLAPLFELFTPTPTVAETAAPAQAMLAQLGAADEAPLIGSATATVMASAEALEIAALAASPADTPPPAPSPATPATAAAAPPPAGEAQPEMVLSALPSETRRELLALTQQIVAELYPAGADEPALKEVTAFVERLFARSGGPAKEGSQALHQAARELEVRLDLLKEALERSALPHKEELLGQTSKLLQQTEALREQRLLCLQLPIQFAEQRQTAELYVYRRAKGGQKLDPRHATILLALNTEHLGRLEAFIQVRQRDIDLKLDISQNDAVPFVREATRALPKLLAEAGYRLSSATVQPLVKETGPPTAERALEEFQKSFGHQVDMTI